MDSIEVRAHLEQHHTLSFGWAMNCCYRDLALAEEVLQTVYLKILEGRARYNGKSTFKTWLFGVIRKTALHERRRHWLRNLRFPNYDEHIQETQHGESPDETLHRSELQMLFRQTLDALPKRQREVLHLVFYDDLSIEEAGEVMGVSVGSARTHYERGKKRFRQRLEESRIFHESGLARTKDQGAVPKTATG